MNVSSLFLATLLFIFTVRSENPATTEAKYREQAEKGYGLCPGMQKVVQMNMAECFVQYLDLECACFFDLKIYNSAVGTFVIQWIFSLMTIFMEALRNLTGSNVKDDPKRAAQAMSSICNQSDKQVTVDYFIKLLKVEFAICQITPEDKIKAVGGAVHHCSKQCPYKKP